MILENGEIYFYFSRQYFNGKISQINIQVSNGGMPQLFISLFEDDIAEIMNLIFDEKKENFSGALLSITKLDGNLQKISIKNSSLSLDLNARQSAQLEDFFYTLDYPDYDEKIFEDSKRHFEADVFIGLPDDNLSLIEIERLQFAIGEFMEELGFEYETKSEPIFGSFFQYLRFKTKHPKTVEEIDQLYQDGKTALRLKYLNLPNAESTDKLANAAATLIDRLAPFKKGILRAGAILVVKTTIENEPYLVVETMSPQLSMELDNNPKLLRDPEFLLKFIGHEPKKSLDMSTDNDNIQVV